MTLQECYAKLEGDYAAVSSRLPSEKFIQKYVLKFAEDKTMELLEEAWQNGNSTKPSGPRTPSRACARI